MEPLVGIACRLYGPTRWGGLAVLIRRPGIWMHFDFLGILSLRETGAVPFVGAAQRRGPEERIARTLGMCMCVVVGRFMVIARDCIGR